MSNLNDRIEAMYRGDVLGASAFVAILWIVVTFVLYMSWSHIPIEGVRTVALLAAVVLLIFNTASVAAMIRNYKADKEFIYGLDLKNLDKSRKELE